MENLAHITWINYIIILPLYTHSIPIIFSLYSQYSPHELATSFIQSHINPISISMDPNTFSESDLSMLRGVNHFDWEVTWIHRNSFYTENCLMFSLYIIIYSHYLYMIVSYSFQCY